MKLYNTLTKQLQDIPKTQDPITFYSCGPTVYDFPHIGNWYAFVRWDLLNRALLVHGYNTKWVMNITDVGHLVSDQDDGEDKLEKGAKREGKTAWDVAAFYGDYFVKKLSELHFSDIYMLPKATEHIPEQIELVSILEKKGHTYTIDDGVYFDTSTLKDYGKLAHLDLEKLKAGARVELNAQKKNPTDFALWKFSPKNEKRDMEWESPWGKGFPGWHIECSAMSMKYLGETLDIHAGGIDHIPVHHTNEIAQSEAATGKPFARLWVHSNFILVDGKKMSKSLGNFYTLEDLKKPDGTAYGYDVFRLAVLSSTYQTEANFSLDQMQAAETRLKSLYTLNELAAQSAPDLAEAMYVSMTDVAQCQQAVLQALAENLNTAEVVKCINDLASSSANKLLRPADVQVFTEFLQFLQQATGLVFVKASPLTSQQTALLTHYANAKTNKNYTESDTVRQQLAQEGVQVKDIAAGVYKWTRQ